MSEFKNQSLTSPSEKPAAPKKIGEFFVEKGILAPQDISPILEYAHAHQLRFGDAALKMGLLTPQKMIQVLGPHYQVDFFSVHPRYFPIQTRDALSLPLILKWKVLPLGSKTQFKFPLGSKTVLNVGFLDPTQSEALAEIRAETQKKWDGIRPYLILEDHYRSILEEIYQTQA